MYNNTDKVNYNNNNKPWVINTCNINSNNSDVSGLIIETISGNIDIINNNGITKFQNDVSFISSVFINKINLANNPNNSNNINGNIELSGNLSLNGNINLNGGIINDISYIKQPILTTEQLIIGISNESNLENVIKIEKDENNLIKLLFF